MPEQINDIKNPVKNRLSWESSEFVEYQKSTGWYLLIGFLGLAVVGVLVWQKIYSGAGVVFLAIIVLFSKSKIKPKANKYILNSEGLTINDKKYPIEEMKLFWSVITSEGNNIYIRTTKKLSAPVTIHLGNYDPEPIEEFLKQYIPQDEKMGEITSDRISRFFRF